jgi:hypothetical protein
MLLILTVFVFHSVRFFDTGDWEVKATWRYTPEMTAGMLALMAVLWGLVSCTQCPIGILCGFGDALMYVAMAAFLLFRPAQHAHGEPTQVCHT